MAFVITGSPGVGKHTIAQKVADRRNLEVLDLSQVAAKPGLAEKKGEALDVDAEKLRNALRGAVSKNTLVVGHLAPYVISRRQAEMVVVLRRSPYKLDCVYKKRGYSKPKRTENQGSEILGIVAHDAMDRFGREKIIQVDTSNRSVTETVRIVSGAITGGAQSDEVDWLEAVNSRGDMRRFFPTD